MAGWKNKLLRLPKTPLPAPKKIATRGLYEILFNAKPRDYSKRLK